MAKKKNEQLSGGARLTAAGKVAVLLGVDPADIEIIRAAAEKEKRPVTQFLLYHGLEAAKKILEKDAN